VYIDLIGARQSQLILAEKVQVHVGTASDTPRRQRMEPLLPRLTAAELAAHQAFIATLGEKAMWSEFAEA
jgi:DNA polymerase-3 subunit epsilon